jgi:hypothetical protein
MSYIYYGLKYCYDKIIKFINYRMIKIEPPYNGV